MVMTKARAKYELRKMGFEFDEAVTGRIGLAWMATIDPIGRRSIAGDCRGIVVHDYTASAAEFWGECVREAKAHSRLLQPCTDLDCEFHA